MSIKTATVLKDGTVATTGGTSVGFIEKGTLPGVNNSWVGIVDDGSEYLNQTRFTFVVKDPVPDASAPNGYTQQRISVNVFTPLALDNGNRTVRKGSITISEDIESTAAERLTMRVYLAQLLTDPDYTELWENGALG